MSNRGFFPPSPSNNQMGADNPKLFQIIFKPDPTRLADEFNDDDVKMLLVELKQYALARLGLTPKLRRGDQRSGVKYDKSSSKWHNRAHSSYPVA